MPIYEYRCDDCGQQAEIWLRHSHDQPHCPMCGSVALVKRFSPAHARLSASGPGAATTCCGQAERCARPPCGAGGCQRG